MLAIVPASTILTIHALLRRVEHVSLAPALFSMPWQVGAKQACSNSDAGLGAVTRVLASGLER